MKLSLEWMTSYLKDCTLPAPEALALKLTMATAEVEGVEHLERHHKNVVIGKVLSVTPHAESRPDHPLSIVEADIGGGRTIKTICGAPNVKSGLTTAIALTGAELSGGQKVVKEERHGLMCEAMLCSLKELGWGDFHYGVIELPADLKPGTPLSELVPDDDYLIEFDNKSLTHRADLWGHYGFARELAAILHGQLSPLDTYDLKQHDDLPALDITIDDDPEGGRGYSGVRLENLSTAPSPAIIQARLAAVGSRPINILVDLTNYLLWELAQPMHSFDGRKIDRVRVAPFGHEGTFMTLDDEERKMIKSDLMIFNGEEPVAIAGVMGGHDSQVFDDTTSLFLESANFYPARVRRTALRLALRTDSSLRFEKNQPICNMELALKRYVKLLMDGGQKVKVASKMTTIIPRPKEPAKITLEPGYIKNKVGMDISEETINSILKSLEFQVEVGEGGTTIVTAPQHRTDIAIAQDLVEEVARVYGYDNITPAMPKVEQTPLKHLIEHDRLQIVRRLMASAHNFNEVHAYSWFDDEWLKELKAAPKETLKIANPCAGHLARLRTSLIPGLLAFTNMNRHHTDTLRLFEAGKVYFPKGEKDWQEHDNLGAVFFRLTKNGSLSDLFAEAKGVLKSVMENGARGEEYELVPAEKSSEWPWIDPAICLAVKGKDGKLYGHIGHLAQSQLAPFGKGAEVVWFELSLAAMSGPIYPEVHFKAPANVPGSWLDFSVLFPAGKPYGEFSEIIKKFENPLTKGWQFVSSYTGKGLPEGMVSYSIRYWLGRADRTISGEEITGFHQALLKHLEEHKLTLR